MKIQLTTNRPERNKFKKCACCGYYLPVENKFDTCMYGCGNNGTRDESMHKCFTSRPQPLLIEEFNSPTSWL